MCLIAYVKAGQKLPEHYMRAAAKDNSDGIGVMSIDGIEKFLGRKMVKKAWRYIRELNDKGAEYAVHFRFATHGRISLANTHPFASPQGDVAVMHNGILSQYTPTDKNGTTSDTREFIAKVAPFGDFDDKEYWAKMKSHIGGYNKLCIMRWDGVFKLVNEDAGDWINGVWYSQTYSLPGQSRYGNPRWWDTTAADATSYYVGGRETPVYDGGYGTLAAAYLRRDGARHTHYVERGGYVRDMTHDEKGTETMLLTHDEEAAALDAALAAHLTDEDYEDEGEGNYICESCQSISTVDEGDLQMGRVVCPECGYVEDMDMLGYAGGVQKCSV